MRLVFIILCFLGAAASAYYGEPYVKENADATLIIITVLTIFAGFLVAIITVLGDPSLIPSGSWRMSENRRQNVENQLIRHTWLFVLYLVGIGFLFVGSLLHKAPTVSEDWKIWIDRTYLFFGVFAFLLTFGLPRSLLALQLKRWDSETEKRRADAGIANGEKKDD